jgi:hypothetical protein
VEKKKTKIHLFGASHTNNQMKAPKNALSPNFGEGYKGPQHSPTFHTKTQQDDTLGDSVYIYSLGM